MTTHKIERQEAFSGTKPVSASLLFDVNVLEAYLAENIADFSGPLTVSQFKGGQSNPTYLVRTLQAEYVLRRKPPGVLLPSAHAVDREFRVIQALHAQGFPVAKPYLLCNDEHVIGTVFYVMEYVEGRVIWEPHVPNASPRERARLYDGLNKTIASLHKIDIDAAGLSDFGKPQNYVARQIKRWSQQYCRSQTQNIPEMDRLMNWLPGACPENTPIALVHGDFRLDNVILDPVKPKVLAVLDWELSTLGDPWGDFSYHLMQWAMPRSKTGAGTGTLLGHDLEALGIPPLQTYIEHYSERTGFGVPENLSFYFAYNFFRLAAILQGIVGRAQEGTAANPHALAQAGEISPLAKTAWDFAQRAGAQ
jgi:aminoglycoside phosphotransferase (APT) family kinase protein